MCSPLLIRFFYFELQNILLFMHGHTNVIMPYWSPFQQVFPRVVSELSECLTVLGYASYSI